MISASGACSLMLRIASKPESPPSARSTSATSNCAAGEGGVHRSKRGSTQSTRYLAPSPRHRNFASQDRPLSTINSETGRMVITVIPRADGTADGDHRPVIDALPENRGRWWQEPRRHRSGCTAYAMVSKRVRLVPVAPTRRGECGFGVETHATPGCFENET